MTWIQTKSRIRFDLANPRVEDVEIEDIAHALSHICRFVGHTSEFYSVAQHCCLVSDILPKQYALCGLLHDAHEAYIGDHSRPSRSLLGEPLEYVESRVQRVVLARFGLPCHVPPQVKQADEVLLSTEARFLMGDCMPGWQWSTGQRPRPAFRSMTAWHPVVAKDAFLRRFHDLIPSHQSSPRPCDLAGAEAEMDYYQ